jgi:uracil phosphoribosyltransferase
MAWLEHKYGNRVHILDDLLTNTWLTELCEPQTRQPRLNTLVEFLYHQILVQVLNHIFPSSMVTKPTRMSVAHPEEGRVTSHIIDPETRAITVNLARAGTWPSHLCYSLLNDILNPDQVRQDHIFAARKSNSLNQVTGTDLGAHKIGGDQNGAFVMFPDPMGATGHTLIAAIDYYKKNIPGVAKRYIAMHLIITPEYLKNVLSAHKDVEIFALRVDRGLSDEKVLKSIPGEMWELEKGLNSHDYIVPGAGGLGELLNNSFV